MLVASLYFALLSSYPVSTAYSIEVYVANVTPETSQVSRNAATPHVSPALETPFTCLFFHQTGDTNNLTR